MKFLWLILIVAVALAQMVVGTKADGQQSGDDSEGYCLADKCDPPKCPMGLSWNGEKCVMDCQCGMASE
uniref:Uncharacterized protein n=1 Tax=Anopheles epiroticus TaxID=199890 RepID=A0A182PDI1_9DIPT